MKLGLGTAQFGMQYGILNREGAPDVTEVREILSFALKSGIDFLDTAALYGESEKVLGSALQSNPGFRIVTKTSKITATEVRSSDVGVIHETFMRSLERLMASSVYGLLIHDADDLLKDGGERLFEALLSLRQQGLIRKIGASVYSGSQINEILERFPVELIQLPVSILDQRLIMSGHLKELKRRGIEVHARSVFLQGLLLMTPNDVPAGLAAARPWLSRVHDLAKHAGLTPLEAVLSFVMGVDEIDQTVVGVCSRAQLEEVVLATKRRSSEEFQRLAAECSCYDESIVNPSRWKVP